VIDNPSIIEFAKAAEQREGQLEDLESVTEEEEDDADAAADVGNDEEQEEEGGTEPATTTQEGEGDSEDGIE
jgi:hypothetical protein